MKRHPSKPVDVEMQHHLDECTDYLVSQGMSPHDARREARRRFGDLPQYKRTCEKLMKSVTRDTRRVETLHSLWQDLRYTVRGIRNNRAFAAGLILTLGLGIGANTAIFTVVDAILLRPLPYMAPEQLVRLQPFNPDTKFAIPRAPMATARAWERAADFVDHAAVYESMAVVRSGGDEPVSVNAIAATAELAATLGVQPTLGRWFVEDDLLPGATPVVVLGHHMWRRWFDEDPGALNQEIVLSEIPHMVIGVMPPAFRFPSVNSSNFFVPLGTDNRAVGTELFGASVIGRLADGVSVAEAEERANIMADEIGVLDPQWASFRAISVSELDSWRANPEVKQALWTLTAAVALMWLIAIGNGVNLIAVRSSARSREMALRLSLGASRPRLLRQLLTESVVLSLLGGLAAVLLARASMAAIVGLIPESVVNLSANEIVFGDRVVWFAYSLSMLTGLAVGLLPAMQILRPRGSTSVSAMDLQGASKKHTAGTRRALVVIQVALSMTLLVGAGLVINSFTRLTRVEPGFNAENLIYLTLNLPVHADEYRTRELREDFYARLGDRLEGVPGVRAVTLADGLPPDAGFSFGLALATEDGTASADQPFWLPRANVRSNYFELMEIPLVAGRNFNATDDADTRTVIIDVDLARFLWSDENPVGQRFRMEADSDPYTVIGVVGDVKLLGPDDRRGAFEMYHPLTIVRRWMSFAIRTDMDPQAVMPSVRAAVWELDPDLPVVRLDTAERALAESVDGPRFLVTLLSVAAAIALALVAIGVYGVLAFTVSQRTRELGVRIALGATTPNLRGMVLRDGLRLAVLGVVLGLGGAVALSRIMQSLLFNVEPTDPVTLAAVSALMLGVAGLACYLPARAATSVDPMVALRTE